MVLYEILEEYDYGNKLAFFFDVDGTLAQTQKAHFYAYKMAFMLNDKYFDEQAFWDNHQFGGKVLMPALLPGEDKEVVDAIIEDKKKLLPYALKKFMTSNDELVDLIFDLSLQNKKIVIVSNGREESIKNILIDLGIFNNVDHIITSDILGSLKPSPEGYNYALKLTGTKPEEVIVFEDNEIGFSAARDAGIQDIIGVKYDEENEEF